MAALCPPLHAVLWIGTSSESTGFLCKLNGHVWIVIPECSISHKRRSGLKFRCRVNLLQVFSYICIYTCAPIEFYMY